MLLLKYPAPDPAHGPQTFVDDAVYLRDNFSATGGAKIVGKYSGRSPSIDLSRPETPLGQAPSHKRNLSRTKSPLPSPARFLQQQGGIEALFQGARKGVLDRGERLGINQAVRDAVGEVKKNMQGLQASRNNSASRRASDVMRWSLDEGRSVPASRASVTAMNNRNKKLARMLEQAMADLRMVTKSPNGDKEAYIEGIDLAIAKVEFVKVYLEDATMPLPEIPSSKGSSTGTPQQSVQDSLEPTNEGVLGTSVLSSRAQTPPANTAIKPLRASPIPDALPESVKISKEESSEDQIPSIKFLVKESGPPDAELPSRPKAPVPTRSTIAQSSFSWMLEPDTSSAPTLNSSPPKSSSPFLKSGRRPLKREKAAFLFGEDGGESSTRLPSVDAEEAFSLGAMKINSTVHNGKGA